MYPLSSSDDHPGHLYLQATQGFLRGAGCYGKSKLCSCVRTPKGPNTGGDMDDMGRFKQVGTEMSVDFAVDSAMINSGAAGLPLSCLYHLTISSCWLTTPSEASKNGDCKWPSTGKARISARGVQGFIPARRSK